MCPGNQIDPDTGSEVLLENISQEFSSKEELGNLVSDKLSKIVNTFIFNMEEEKNRTINKRYRRQENYSSIVAPKANSEIWNENLQGSYRITDINLKKILLLKVSKAYAVIEACEKMVSRISFHREGSKG